MAILFADGFEFYGTGGAARTAMLDGAYLSVGASIYVSISEDFFRTGSRSIGLSGGTAANGIRIGLGADYNEVGFSFAQYYTEIRNVNTFGGVVVSDNDGAAIVSITPSSAGEFIIKRGNQSGVEVGRTGQVLSAASWQHVEIKLKIGSSDGACEIRINGQTVISLSDLNINPTGKDMADVAFAGANGVMTYIDDLVVWSTIGSAPTDFIGQKQLFPMIPDGDTLVADFVPSSGSDGFPMIAKTDPDDDTYISASNVNDASEFSLSNTPGNVTDVLAVTVQTRSMKETEGIANLEVGLVSNSIYAGGQDRPLTTQPTYYFDAFALDPSTGSPWTKSGVDSCLLRVTKTA